MTRPAPLDDALRTTRPVGEAGVAAGLGTAPMSDAAERRAAARAAIVGAWREFARAAGMSPSAAAERWCTLYNTGEVTVEAWVRATVGHVCARSLTTWGRGSAKAGFGALAGRYGEHRRGTGAFDTDADLRELAVGLLAGSPHVDAAQVHRALEARFADRRPIPSLRSTRRFVAGYRAANPGVLLSLANPDAHRSRLRVAFGCASGDVRALNDLWELDSTPTDVLCADGRRHALVGVIDVWSRRLMIHVTPTSSGIAVTTAIRRAILAWGVPARIKTDNGQDYASRHVTRALVDLGIEHTLCPPYSPERKPHIERVLGTLSHQFLELLPGYLGHSVEDQQAIRARRSFAERREHEAPIEIRLSPAELQARLDDWCEHVYGRAPHRSLGRSPFEMAASWTAPVHRVADERALDVLLAPAPDNDGLRRVTKRGIAVEGALFIAAELGPLVGEEVRVRLDPADMGGIWVFRATDGAFVCRAWCPERAGIDRATVASEARARQAKAVSEKRRELKALARKVDAGAIAEEIVAAGRRRAGQVVAMPRRGEAHETPAIAAAGQAARVDETPLPLPLTDAERQAKARATARIDAAPRATPAQAARERYARATAIETTLARGETPDEADTRWLASYRLSSEYRTHRSLRRLSATG